MTEIRVSVDVTVVRRALSRAPQEARRAVRNALNDTLRDVQKDERAHILSAFEVRARSFILNSVKIEKDDRATTDRLEGAIGIDPQRNILAKFERGGPKVSLRGKRYVAVPTREIATKGGHVKPQFAFKRFQPFAEASALHSVRLMGSRREADRRPRLVGQHNSFFIELRSGRPALAQRFGRGGSRLRVLWLFLPQVQLPALLKFERVALASIARHWPRNAMAAIPHALRRAGLNVTGG